MKKLISKIICVLLLVSFAFALTACGDEVENGSKITRVKLTVEFYDEEAALFNHWSMFETEYRLLP